jgi:hypothetical protein
VPEHTAPIITQYASPDLIEAIAYRGHDPRDDPRWAETGAADQDEYGTWCRHMCGIACLATYLHHARGHAPALFDLLAGARKHGAYTVDPDGQIHGLIYQPFAEYVTAEHGITATVHPVLPVGGLLEALDHGHTAIVSVHKEIRRPDLPPPGTGGHLVLATGHHDGHVWFRNPSGHTPQARDGALPKATFAAFYAQRGIVLGHAAPERHAPLAD